MHGDAWIGAVRNVNFDSEISLSNPCMILNDKETETEVKVLRNQVFIE